MVLALPLLAGCNLADLFGNGQNNSSANKNLFAIDVVGNIKTEYVLNESFDANGAKLKLIYDDNSSIELSLDKTMTNFDSTTVGKKDLTVTYQGKTKVLEYRVDAFKFGRYENTLTYAGISDFPVATENHDNYWIFEKNGTGYITYLNGEQAGQEVRIDLTWSYVNDNTLLVSLNDTMGQTCNVAIKSQTNLVYVYSNTPGTTPGGVEYAKVLYVLNYVQ